MNKITQSRIKELFTYCQETGEFKRNKKVCGSNGFKVAEKNDYYGYKTVKVDGKSYRLHRLAWCYIYGNFPNCEIDHINQDRSDNRIKNLRLATRSENMRNKKTHKNNKLGNIGIHLHKNGKYIVQISGDDNKRYRGQYDSLEEAIIVRKRYEKKFNYTSK